MQRHTIYSASSHKWEAYRRRRFGRFSRRERRSYLDLYVRSEQRGKSAKAPSALRVGLKRVRLRRCSFVTSRTSLTAAGANQIVTREKLVRDVTDKQRGRRPIFNATLRAAAGWLFFCVARSLRINLDMLVACALKNRQLTCGDVIIICETAH